ncbi:MAG: DinB family protein [Anaerolineales bacterium]
MSHPLADQLRFTRREFLRGVEQVSEEDAARRFMPMNCISWNVGHLAAQEQRYFLSFTQDLRPYPKIDESFSYGSPASTPSLRAMLEAWQAITQAVDPWLDELTSDRLLKPVVIKGKQTRYTVGSLMLRVIYHYWYHAGENLAVRQMLGHTNLPEFVGDLDGEAPFRSEIGQGT